MINTSILRFGGAVQVALSLIHECRAHPEHEYHVVVGSGVGAVLDEDDFPDNFHFHHKQFGVIGLGKLAKVQREMAKLEDQIQPDCVVTTAGPAYWHSKAPHLVGFNRGLFIYPEMIWLGLMDRGKQLRLAIQRTIHRRLYRREADALLVQTDDVNQRAQKFLAIERVYTVSNTYSGWFDQPANYPPRLSNRRTTRFRFLTVSNYYLHKNLELIPEIVRVLPKSIRNRIEFVLTLTENDYLLKIGGPIPKQIKLIGPVPPPECPALYRECDAMFLPTLVECFSASYPEAMKMEKPIITTDLGFARSICGDAALYFEPCNAQSAAEQIMRLIDNDDLKNSLKKNGLKRLYAFDSPAQRAEKILAICANLAANHQHETAKASTA